jgi:DNA topoisomerase-1
MSSTDEDVPLKRFIKSESPTVMAKKSRILDDSDEDMPLRPPSAQSSTSVKRESPKKIRKSPKKEKVKKEQKSPKKQEEEEEEYKWWLEENRDDTIKWNSLVHNGVLFPPDYEPHGVKMKYKGKEVELSPNSEEVASFYAALIGTDWVQNEVFQKNFFNDFIQVCFFFKKLGFKG